MKVVKFLQPCSPYAVGDIAGVSDEEAEKFIADGVAEKYKKEKSVDEPEENTAMSSPPVKK